MKRVTTGAPYALKPKRPNLDVVRARYRAPHDRKGAPYFLPIWEDLENLVDLNAKKPWQCPGPPNEREQLGKRRYKCGNEFLCAYCWWSRTWNHALKTAIVHADAKVAYKWSVSLPGIRTDPGPVREVRTKLSRLMRDHGFEQQTIFIHTFGKNVAEGPKGHLDGHVSTRNADDLDDLFKGTQQAVRDLIMPYSREFGKGQRLYFEPLNPARRDYIKRLVLGGEYAGRPTFETPRLIAGLYGQRGNLMVRQTDVNRKTAKRGTCTVHDLTSNNAPAPDLTHTQLIQAALTAYEWREATGRPVISRGTNLASWKLDEVLDQTKWRYRFRLSGKTRLRADYEATSKPTSLTLSSRREEEKDTTKT